MEKDSKIYRGKKERVKSIALKAKKESSDNETSTFESDDEEYAMAVRNFKKFFRRNDAVIQIISLAIVQNHLATKIKRPSLKVLRAIAKMTPKTKPTMKLVSWLNHRMSQNLCDDFAKIMHDEFEMSMMGELNFFLGLQIKQMEDEIFFNQSNYIKEMLNKFGLEDSKPTKMLMSMEIKLTKNDEAHSVDSSKHQGCCLTSWFAKKQTTLSISTTETEYASTEKACQQTLWMKQSLIDYGIRLDNVPIMCDNKGAIDLSKNPIQHSRTKHIEIRHHFLRDNVQKGNIFIEKVAPEDNIADIFTKPLKCKVFNYLRLGLGMMKLIMDSDSPSSQNNHKR
nr:copia protein [Tanacetum cinerariifolium]